MSDKIKKLVEGIAGLDPEKDFTDGGLPRVEPLEAITGIANITAKERDAAWEIYKAEKDAPKDGDNSEDETPPEETEPDVTEPPEAPKEKESGDPCYVIAKGRSTTATWGIIGEGKPVSAKHLAGGEKAMKYLIEEGVAVIK